MYMFKEKLSDSLKRSLVEYCYDIIGCMHDTYKELSPGLPEPIFQEALQISLFDAGYKDAVREYHHYPKFRNKKLSSHIQVDIMVVVAVQILVQEEVDQDMYQICYIHLCYIAEMWNFCLQMVLKQ